MKENYFMGQDGFVWFVGVVESREGTENKNNDPVNLFVFGRSEI